MGTVLSAQRAAGVIQRHFKKDEIPFVRPGGEFLQQSRFKLLPIKNFRLVSLNRAGQMRSSAQRHE